MFVKNIRLENQEMELAVICQAKYDARFVEFLSQNKDVMTEKIILQLMILWTCTATVATAW